MKKLAPRCKPATRSVAPCYTRCREAAACVRAETRKNHTEGVFDGPCPSKGVRSNGIIKLSKLALTRLCARGPRVRFARSPRAGPCSCIRQDRNGRCELRGRSVKYVSRSENSINLSTNKNFSAKHVQFRNQPLPC